MPCSTLLLILAPFSPQSPHLELSGLAPGDAFGAAVAEAGDVNADGHADLIVGARGDDRAGIDAGAAMVYSGLDGSLLHTFLGVAPGDRFGWSVACAMDVNHDGHDDLLVGAPGAHGNRGTSLLFSGADGNVLRRWIGSQSACRHGTAVAGIGDWNGDGWPDLLVGEPEGSPASWSAYLFSGSNGQVLILFGGLGGLGATLSGVGDLDGDGRPDALLGRFRDPTSGPLAGMVWVWGTMPWTFHYGDDAADNFGWSVDGAGDVDGDGVPDFVAGAPGDELGGRVAGSLRVHSGADGRRIHNFVGSDPGGGLGWSVAGVGDANGDGRADVLAGAPFADELAAGAGHARLFSGIDGSILWSLDGDSEAGQLGFCVSGAGDVDADGLDDWAVGEPGFRQGAGRVQVFLGRADLGR